MDNKLTIQSRVIKPAELVTVPKPPYIGYIRTGVMDEKTKKGKPLPYFHLVPANKNHTILIDHFKKLNGPTPTILQIYFHTSDVSQVAINLHEAFLNKRRLAYSDGKVVCIEHPVKHTEHTLTVDAIQALPNHDPLKQQWDMLWARNLFKETLELKFFIKNFPALGLFVYKTTGEKSSIKNVFRTLDRATAQLGGFHNLSFYFVLHQGKIGGSPIKYNAVDLIDNYSVEHYYHIKNGLDAGILDLDKCSYLHIDKYLEQTCPQVAFTPPQMYLEPTYNGESDVNMEEYDLEAEYAEFEEQHKMDEPKPEGEPENPDQLKMFDENEIK